MYGFPWTEPETWYTTCVPNIISTVLVTAFSSTVVAAFLGARKAKKQEQHRLAHETDNEYDQVRPSVVRLGAEHGRFGGVCGPLSSPPRFAFPSAHATGVCAPSWRGRRLTLRR